MEDWELDFEWLKVRHYIKDALQHAQLPDLNVVLLLIGIQELGRWKKGFTKEEKQDLMHIGVCRLLEYDGYYKFVGRDEDGWPHFRQTLEMPKMDANTQEKMLKVNAVRYFKALDAELEE
ncbi:MAG: hypothetical protein KGS48_02615 [Bacteroidetes bacterium]|nr:hypothetical protein [Bacteroidota bacterium]